MLPNENFCRANLSWDDATPMSRPGPKWTEHSINWMLSVGLQWREQLGLARADRNGIRQHPLARKRPTGHDYIRSWWNRCQLQQIAEIPGSHLKSSSTSPFASVAFLYSFNLWGLLDTPTCIQPTQPLRGCRYFYFAWSLAYHLFGTYRPGSFCVIDEGLNGSASGS